MRLDRKRRISCRNRATLNRHIRETMPETRILQDGKTEKFTAFRFS